ncbi:MAG: hypothetical protein KAV87_08655 [Desulfobacteraceae bacterium]|nr:hypothetical protein [Desulfobacteraceae bacterium]
MKVVSKEFRLRITVECEDKERESTEDRLTNDNYQLVSDWQYLSNNYQIVAERRDLIKFSDKQFKDAVPITAAKGFAKLNNIQIQCYDVVSPEIESSKLDDFQLSVKLRSQQGNKYYYVYLIEQNGQYEAVAWSEDVI